MPSIHAADTLGTDDDDDMEARREQLRQKRSATPPAAAPSSRKAHVSTSFSATERVRELQRHRNEREASSDPGRSRHQRNHPGRQRRDSSEERSRSRHQTPTVREERVSSPASSETSSNPRSAPSRMTRSKILESEPRTSKRGVLLIICTLLWALVIQCASAKRNDGCLYEYSVHPHKVH